MARKRRKQGLVGLVPLMLLGGLAVGAVAVGVASYQQRARIIAATTAAAKPEALVGEPCPTLTAEAFAARGVPVDKAFVFNEIRYQRRFGHADCNVVSTGKGGVDYVPVCQFNGPSLLVVTTERGTYHFAPGTGKPATVSTSDGVPSCVLAANFKS